MNWIKIQKKILGEIARQRAWYLGEFGDREAYADRATLWLVPKEILLLVKEPRRDGREVLRPLSEKWVEDATPVDLYCQARDQRQMEYFANSNGVTVCVDKTRRKDFDGCEYRATSPEMPLVCYENDEICGVVMPIRISEDDIIIKGLKKYLEGLENDRN